MEEGGSDTPDRSPTAGEGGRLDAVATEFYADLRLAPLLRQLLADWAYADQ